jgi:hypothetical protein
MSSPRSRCRRPRLHRLSTPPLCVKFDGFCVIYLLGVFAIGSSSFISFFRSIPPVNYVTLVCNHLWVFVAGISEIWLQIRRFTFFKKCQSTTRLLACYFWRLNSAKDCWLVAVAENISCLPVTHHEFRLDPPCMNSG